MCHSVPLWQWYICALSVPVSRRPLPQNLFFWSSSHHSVKWFCNQLCCAELTDNMSESDRHSMCLWKQKWGHVFLKTNEKSVESQFKAQQSTLSSRFVRAEKMKSMCCVYYHSAPPPKCCVNDNKDSSHWRFGKEEALLMERCWAYREILSVLLCSSAAFVSALDDLMPESFP